MTNWYAGFVKVHHFNDPAYASHHEAYGQGRLLVMDDFSQTLNENLGPWVNHLYLFLAGFNIALRNREGVREVLGTRLRVFLALFVFFILETAITSQSVGESFSIYPLHMWMIVLSLLERPLLLRCAADHEFAQAHGRVGVVVPALLPCAQALG